MNSLRPVALPLHFKSSSTVYRNYIIDYCCGKPQEDSIDLHWAQFFCERLRNVSSLKTGKLQLSAEKTVALENDVASHLGRLTQGFGSRDFDDRCTRNGYDTHTTFSLDKRGALELVYEEVRYACVTYCSEGTTMLLRISGSAEKRIETPLMIFKNKERNYPMHNVMGNVQSVAYCTEENG